MLNLDQNESVILEVRKHWIVFFSHGLFLVFAAVLPVILFIVFKRIIPVPIAFFEHTSVWVFFYMIWLLGVWISFFIQWTNYYLDVWYITEKRIIDVEQKRPFHREVSSIRFDKIQDITIEVKGVVATLLNYADVRVQTASESVGDFVMYTAANPERIREKVFSQHNNQAERIQQVTIVDRNNDGKPDHI